jgi:hypothetical protein
MARDDEAARKLKIEALDEDELETVRSATAEIRACEEERDAINARMNAARKRIKALGVDLDAWRASKRRLEMDPEDRTKFDHSHIQCNKALNVPLRGQLSLIS